MVLPDNTVQISWNTSDNASSQVFYDTQSHGDTGAYAFQSAIDSAPVLQHAVTLGGLQGSTVYHFRTMSTANVSGILFTAISEDLTFETADTINLMAETGISQSTNTTATTDIVVVKVDINRIKNPADNVTANIPGGIGSYSATVNGTPGNAIQFLTVYGLAPFIQPTFDNTTGVFSATAITSPPQAGTVAKVVPVLTGNNATSVILSVAFQDIRSATQPGLNVPEEYSNNITFKRGDAFVGGGITIADSLAIKQFLVSQLTLSQINPLNAASVNHDGTGGDKITIADALAIEQYLVGQRNAYYIVQ